MMSFQEAQACHLKHCLFFVRKIGSDESEPLETAKLLKDKTHVFFQA
jgi:hypothetical protein